MDEGVRKSTRKKSFALSSLVPSQATSVFEGISTIKHSTCGSRENLLVEEDLACEENQSTNEVLRDASDGNGSLSFSEVKSPEERSNDNELAELEKLKAELRLLVCRNRERRTNVVVGRPQAMSTPLVPSNSPVDVAAFERNVASFPSLSSENFSQNFDSEQPVLEFTFVSPHPLAFDGSYQGDVHIPGKPCEIEKSNFVGACVRNTGDPGEADKKGTNDSSFEETVDYSESSESELVRLCDECEEEMTDHSERLDEEINSKHSGGCGKKISDHNDEFNEKMRNNRGDNESTGVKNVLGDKQKNDEENMSKVIDLNECVSRNNDPSGAVVIQSEPLSDEDKEKFCFRRKFSDENTVVGVTSSENTIGHCRSDPEAFGVITGHCKENEGETTDLSELERIVAKPLEKTISPLSFSNGTGVAVSLTGSQGNASLRCQSLTESNCIEEKSTGEKLESLVHNFKDQTDSLLADSEEKVSQFSALFTRVNDILDSYSPCEITVEFLESSHVLPSTSVPKFSDDLPCKTIASSCPSRDVSATASPNEHMFGNANESKHSFVRDHVEKSQGLASKSSSVTGANPTGAVEEHLSLPTILVEPPPHGEETSMETFEVASKGASASADRRMQAMLQEHFEPLTEGILQSTSVTSNILLDSAKLKFKTPSLVGGYHFVDYMRYEESPAFYTTENKGIKLSKTEFNDGTKGKIHVSIGSQDKITNFAVNSKEQNFEGSSVMLDCGETNSNISSRPSHPKSAFRPFSKFSNEVITKDQLTPVPTLLSDQDELAGLAVVQNQDVKGHPPLIWYENLSEVRSSVSSTYSTVTCEGKVTRGHSVSSYVFLPSTSENRQSKFGVANVETSPFNKNPLVHSSIPLCEMIPLTDASHSNNGNKSYCQQLTSSGTANLSFEVDSLNDDHNHSLPAIPVVHYSECGNLALSDPNDHTSLETEEYDCPKNLSGPDVSINFSSSLNLQSNNQMGCFPEMLSRENEGSQRHKAELDNKISVCSELDFANANSIAPANLNTLSFDLNFENEEATESAGFYHLENLQEILSSTSPPSSSPIEEFSPNDAGIIADSSQTNGTGGGGNGSEIDPSIERCLGACAELRSDNLHLRKETSGGGNGCEIDPSIERCLGACAELRSENLHLRKVVTDFQEMTLQQLEQLSQLKEDLASECEKLMTQNTSLKDVLTKVIKDNESVRKMLCNMGEENENVKSLLDSIEVDIETLTDAQSNHSPVCASDGEECAAEGMLEYECKKLPVLQNATDCSMDETSLGSLKAENESLQHQITELKLKLSDYEELKIKYDHIFYGLDLNLGNDRPKSQVGDFTNSDSDCENKTHKFVAANVKCLLKQYAANRVTMDKLRDQVFSVLVALYKAPEVFNYELLERKFALLWETCTLTSLINDGSSCGDYCAVADCPTKIIGKSLMFHPKIMESTIFYVTDKCFKKNCDISPHVASEIHRWRRSHMANEKFFRTRYIQTDFATSKKDKLIQTEEEIPLGLVDRVKVGCRPSEIGNVNSVYRSVTECVPRTGLGPSEVSSSDMEATVKNLRESLVNAEASDAELIQTLQAIIDFLKRGSAAHSLYSDDLVKTSFSGENASEETSNVPLAHSSWEEIKTSKGSLNCSTASVLEMENQAAKTKDCWASLDVSAVSRQPMSCYRRNVLVKMRAMTTEDATDGRPCSESHELDCIAGDHSAPAKVPLAPMQAVKSKSAGASLKSFGPIVEGSVVRASNEDHKVYNKYYKMEETETSCNDGLGIKEQLDIRDSSSNALVITASVAENTRFATTYVTENKTANLISVAKGQTFSASNEPKLESHLLAANEDRDSDSVIPQSSSKLHLNKTTPIDFTHGFDAMKPLCITSTTTLCQGDYNYKAAKPQDVTALCTVQEELNPAVKAQDFLSIHCNTLEPCKYGLQNRNRFTATSCEIDASRTEEFTCQKQLHFIDDVKNAFQSRSGTVSSLEEFRNPGEIKLNQFSDGEGCSSISSEEETSFGRGIGSGNNNPGLKILPLQNLRDRNAPTDKKVTLDSTTGATRSRAPTPHPRFAKRVGHMLATTLGKKIDSVGKNDCTPNSVLKDTYTRVPTPYPNVASYSSHPEETLSGVNAFDAMASPIFEQSSNTSFRSLDQLPHVSSKNKSFKNLGFLFPSVGAVSVADDTPDHSLFETRHAFGDTSHRKIQMNDFNSDVPSTSGVEVLHQEKNVNLSREDMQTIASLPHPEFPVATHTDQMAGPSSDPRPNSFGNVLKHSSYDNHERAEEVRQGMSSRKAIAVSELKRSLLQLFSSINRQELEVCLSKVRSECRGNIVGLTFSEIAAIFREKLCQFKGSNESSCCMICGGVYGSKKTAVLKCCHVFHVKCLIFWLHVRNCCPLCHAALEQMEGLE